MASKRDTLIASAEKSLARGKADAALKDFLKVLEETPNDINILNKVGDLYSRLNRNDEAVPYFARIAEHYSKDGFYVKAIAMYRKVNRADPSRLEVYDKLGELYSKQGLAMEAKSQYQVLADYYLKQDNLTGVIGIYGKMLQIEPQNIQLHVKLADLYTQAKKIQEALKEYLVVAQMLRERNALPEAIQVYEKALKLAPDNFEILKTLVPVLVESGRHEEARAHLRRAIETTPRSVQLFVLGAETAMSANDMAEARSFGAKAQSVDPENEDVVNLVVKIHLKSRRPDLAFHAAVPLVDQSLKRGEAKKALSVLVAIAKAAPENEELLKKVVDVHNAAGDQKGAAPFLASLAEIWRKQGKLSEAAEALRACTRLFPENAEYRSQLSHLESQLPPPPVVQVRPLEQAPPPRRPIEPPRVQPAPPQPVSVRPQGPVPVATPSGEFEFDMSEEEGRPPSRPALPVPVPPQAPAGRFPTFGAATGPPEDVTRPGTSFGNQPPPPSFGQYQQAPGLTFGPSSRSPGGARGSGLDLDIEGPVSYNLPPAEEIEDAVEIEDMSGAMEVVEDAVEEMVVEDMDAVQEVEEASEALEELPLATEFPPASQAPSWMSSFPPPVVEPEVLAPGPTTASGAGPMFTTPSVVPPSAGPPSFSPFSQMRPVPSETAVEEALVEAEIFRKYGLLDKAADQLRTLLAKYEESAKLREKLFEVLLEQGKKDAAREQADALTKIYSQEGREDRIRGLRALLGEPQPPSGVQEAPKPAVPPAYPPTSSEVQPPVEVAPPQGPRVVEEIEVPPSLFRPAETAPPLPAEPVGEVVMTVGDSGQVEAPPVELTEAPALPPPLPMGAPVAPPPFPVLQVPLPEFVTVAPPPMTEVVAAPIPEVEAATAEFPAPVAEAPAPVADVPPAPVLPPHVQAPVALPPVRPRLSSQDLAAALAMPQASKPAVKKEKKPEFDALAQLGLTRGTPAAKSPTRDSGSRTTRLDLSELDAFAGFGKPKKAPPKIEIPAVAEALPVPIEPSLPPILPPPAVEQEIVAQVSPETILEEPVLTPEPLTEFSPESEMLAPDLPVALPSGPSPEELSEIDFCLEQGMVVDAAERLQTLESRFPGHPDVASRRQRLEGGSTEDAKKALNEIFSEDLEMVLDAELGKALTDEMAKGAAEATPGPESPSVQVDESGLFSDEQDFFNFAEELQTEMKQESIVEKAAGPQQEVSLEEIFREFKKGVEQQLSPEDYETHYNLGIAYKEMGLTDEAIGEFQIASKDAAHSVECCSMLGLCFLEKSLPQLAIKWYRKGLETPGIRETDKLGLQYDLASVYANVGDSDNAYRTFLEIYGTDASFRDVADRVKEYETQAN